MLNTFTPGATLPTADLERARAFYEGIGFTVDDTSPFGNLLFNSGDGQFMVYQSAFAGTNKATAMAWDVPGDQFDAVVARLREQGVTFDTFEMAGAEEVGASWDGDVLVMESMRSAWFRDPDGNILAVSTLG